MRKNVSITGTAMVIAAVFVLLLFSSCGTTGGGSDWEPEQQFSDYWYQSEAEITRYELTQARYGEYREGDAVLIFVTEDFLSDKQVKREDYSRNYDSSVSVLKLNMVKKFSTGIYPYSIMTSVFSPVNYERFPHSLKLTTSVQEWCGQVFIQLNSRKRKNEIRSFSYFQNEGDRNYTVDKTWIEDEIWTRIRIAPDSLPTGTITMLPGSVYTRLKHRELVPLEAEVSKENTTYKGKDAVIYSIEYTEDRRSLHITYMKDFPHSIEYFEESYPSGFGSDAQILTTSAEKTHRIMSPYWEKNSNIDSSERSRLGLPIN